MAVKKARVKSWISVLVLQTKKLTNDEIFGHRQDDFSSGHVVVGPRHIVEHASGFVHEEAARHKLPIGAGGDDVFDKLWRTMGDLATGLVQQILPAGLLQIDCIRAPSDLGE